MTDSPLASPYRTDGPAPRERALADGEVLFRIGETVTEMYVIARGRLRLERHLADGRAVLIGRAVAGETVAEASLFAHGYHCDCVAEGPAAVLSYRRDRVLGALRQDSRQAAVLLRHLAAQVQDLRGRVEILSLHAAAPRILAYLAARADPVTGAWQMDRTWKSVAEEIGLTHEALYRALARLERDRLIVRDGGLVRLS